MSNSPTPQERAQLVSIDHVSAMNLLLNLPRFPFFRTESIATVLGKGEGIRLLHACRLCASSSVPMQLFVAGANRNERTWCLLSKDILYKPPYNLHSAANVEYVSHFDHTKAQTDWIIARAIEQGLRSLLLVVSAFHALRAYLTSVASLAKHPQDKWPILLLDTPPVPIGDFVPENNSPPEDMIPGEISRIEKYQPRGDVATYGQLYEYLRWLWASPDLRALTVI
jgi:hypothetical protein